MSDFLERYKDRLNPLEVTQLTSGAHELALRSVRAELGEDFEMFKAGGALWLYTYGYVTQVQGSSSAGGHGKQGCHPDRIAAMRSLPMPGRMVFVDQGHRKWQAVWLDINEPHFAKIDTDTTRKRFGWKVGEMIRGEGLIPFPTEPPVALPRAQEVLA